MAFNINDYEPVEVRLAKFWDKYPEGRVFTELVSHTDTQFIVKASVYRVASDPEPMATGYAEEQVDTGNKRSVNFASALENGETSAIGRALANAGFAPKGARPSREEMTKASRREGAVAIEKPATDLDLVKQMLSAMSKDAGVRKQFVLDALAVSELGSLNDLGDNEIAVVLKKLNEAMSAPFTE